MRWLLVDTGSDELENLGRASIATIDAGIQSNGRPEHTQLVAGIHALAKRSEVKGRKSTIWCVPLDNAVVLDATPTTGFSITNHETGE
jgi:hypothetical protein